MSKFELFLEEKKKKDEKAAWMASYEKELSKRKDHQSGRVCWDTATHLYNQGKDAVEAAKSANSPYKHKNSR